jgi:hypothetical protein
MGSTSSRRPRPGHASAPRCDILALIEDARLTVLRPRLLAARPGGDLKSVMENGHAQIQTTQKYLHTQPDTDHENLDALRRIADRRR